MTKCFWINDLHGEWITVNESVLKKRLRRSGIRNKINAGESLSPVDEKLLDIVDTNAIHYAGPLAGYDKGLHEFFGTKVLVTQSPKLIEPKPGESPMIKGILQKMFSHTQG